jgi:hypothetical protein
MSEVNHSDRVKHLDRVPGFAPDDPTDGRPLLDWKSKYPPQAQRVIWVEAVYLFLLLAVVPILMLFFWVGYPNRWLKLSDDNYGSVVKYSLAWLGGVLGGTLFDIKWLYHVVARQVWHLDRRLWRLFTPHISGGLAFAMIAVISSGMLRVFDKQAPHSRALVVAVAFLVGYFSDSAVAKLSEIAETVFGASRAKEKHKKSPPAGPRAGDALETQAHEETAPSGQLDASNDDAG